MHITINAVALLVDGDMRGITELDSHALCTRRYVPTEQCVPAGYGLESRLHEVTCIECRVKLDQIIEQKGIHSSMQDKLLK